MIVEWIGYEVSTEYSMESLRKQGRYFIVLLKFIDLVIFRPHFREESKSNKITLYSLIQPI